MKFKGLAIPFDEKSTPLSQDNILFQEVVHSDAFKGTVFQDVRLLVEHNDENILARQSAGTLKLFVTGKGLEFLAEVDEEEEYSKQVINRIERGLLNGVSIRFLSKNPITKTLSGYVRNVDEILLLNEISFVSNPAYTETYIEKVEDENVYESYRAVDFKEEKIEVKEEVEKMEEETKEEVVEETVEESVEEPQVQETVEETPVFDNKEIENKLDQLATKMTDLENGQKEIESKLESGRGGNAMEIKQTKIENNEKEAFMEYLQGGTDAQRDGTIKVSDGAPIIPKEIIYTPKDEVKVSYDLTQYVNVLSVNYNSGQYPVMANTTDKMNTADELAQNPSLNKPTFTNVEYSVKTYRGALQYSQEVLDDAVQLESLLNKHVNRIRLNTYNDAIATVLKGATPHTAQGVDGLKEVLNKKLDPAYSNRVIICTQSFYNKLDTFKDATGRYLLQPDITQKSDGYVLNVPIHVISDTLLGSADDCKAFIGDAKQFCTLFLRNEVTAMWVQNEVYGRSLMIGTRFDCKKVDDKAGFFVTLEDPQANEVYSLEEEPESKAKK